MIKLFEKFKKLKYKIGDYVYASSAYLELHNEPVLIDGLLDDGYGCIFVNKQTDGSEDIELLEFEIDRKLTDLEVATIKYNL